MVHGDTLCIYKAGMHLFSIIRNPKYKNPFSKYETIPAAFFNYYDKDIELTPQYPYGKFIKDVNQKLKEFNINNLIAVGINKRGKE